jgi:hypothetical protein
VRRLKRPTLRAVLRWAIVPVVSFVIVVALAMGAAVWSPLPHYSRQTYFGNSRFSVKGVPWAIRRYNGPQTSGVQLSGFAITQYSIWDGDPTALTNFQGSWASFMVYRTGFPFRCMRWTIDLRIGADRPSAWVGGIETAGTFGGLDENRRIPLMPQPVGMALNVLIVSAGMVLPGMVWRRAIEIRRRRRGLCVGCAYPIEPSISACPECGRTYAATNRASRTQTPA